MQAKTELIKAFDDAIRTYGASAPETKALYLQIIGPDEITFCDKVIMVRPLGGGPKIAGSRCGLEPNHSGPCQR